MWAPLSSVLTMIKIYCDNNPKGQSITICGSITELLDLGLAFSTGTNFRLQTNDEPNRFYPIWLKRLEFKLLPDPEALIQIVIQEQQLFLSSGTKTVINLGRSLANFFGGTAMAGEHIHLDYFEGNGLLAPTKYHVIFQCETPIGGH